MILEKLAMILKMLQFSLLNTSSILIT